MGNANFRGYLISWFYAMLLVNFAKISDDTRDNCSVLQCAPAMTPIGAIMSTVSFLDCLTTVLNGLDSSAVQKMNF